MMLEKEFNEICSFRQNNPPLKGRTIKTDSPLAKTALEKLESLKDKLKTEFENYRSVDLTFEYSTGAGNFPNILHTSILPPGQKVSKGIYVVICFDKSGRGALVGCAQSKTNPQGLDVVYRKKSNKDKLQIDVDGHSANTHYNNVFANPKEFYYELKDDSDLIEHIRKSLDLVLFKLNFIDGKDLTLRELVNSNTLPIEFDPTNIEDAREKIMRQIKTRRGQKTFRDNLLKAYGFQCAISKCNIQDLLEAAHIIPYKGKHTNHVQNGILLRADFHTLFDLHLITIDPKTMRVIVDDSLEGTEYYNYQGEKIHMPQKQEFHPSKEALEIRHKKNK